MNDYSGTSLYRQTISDEDEARVLQIFKECDSNQKGHLSKEDIKVAVLSIFGYKPSKYEVEQLMGAGKKDERQGLNLERFQSLMFAKLSLEDPDQECRRIFNAFDIDCVGQVEKAITDQWLSEPPYGSIESSNCSHIDIPRRMQTYIG
ncbi:EF-hand calcium-binding domain-containing protein 11-like isoform X2 [Styela clava]